ncbi:hypothetical protein QFC19_008603 [Naganishia cerealis]|uniref:Uncharacterized protein n=1 Tax=Naganishia cerealis TaxID=610337 RepID=A0ACC2V164_9TREE|nr:hypothetical protein QFC19_008603 [Naganishia cerealis]
MSVTTTSEVFPPDTPEFEPEHVGKSSLQPDDHLPRRPSIGDTPGVHENPLTGAKYVVSDPKDRQQPHIWLRGVTPRLQSKQSSKPETTATDVGKHTTDTETRSKLDIKWEASLHKRNVTPEKIWLNSWGGHTGSSKGTAVSNPSPSVTMTGDGLLHPPSTYSYERRDSVMSIQTTGTDG